ncbi:MAG: histidinol-phosphate transaminase [Epsilonproteobacteria bacterium]|nr:histidinol-phosphate transaminase [Campylobacterota bacterium]
MFESLKDLKVYEAGKPIELVMREYGIKEDEIIKLASNENPYGPSPKVINYVKQKAQLMHRYPDDSFWELKHSLAKKFALDFENFIIGAGSDQVLEFAVHGIKPKKVLMAGMTFAMYEIYSKQVGAEIIKTKSLTHNMDEFLNLYKENNPEIVFICVPNNPLGECIDADEVYSFIESVDNKTLVIVDGAYQEFAKFKDEKKALDVKKLVSYPNVLYTGTFSKAYGLGGMRVGYGIANPQIIKNLHKLRPPFNITILSLYAAIKALEDEEWVSEYIRKNFEEMQRYIDFAKSKGIDYIDSYTNFIVLYIPNSSKIAEELLKRGIIVRDMGSYGFSAIRVTIGKKEENDKLLTILEELI